MDMLQTQFSLLRNDFFLSSDHEFTIGDNWIEKIREGMDESSIVLPIVTSNFVGSQFCLCELGASWVNKKGLVPVIIPPLDHNALNDTPYRGWMQALTIRSEENLLELAQGMKERGLGDVHIPRFRSRAKLFYNEVVIPYIEKVKDKPIVTASEVNKLNNKLIEYEASLDASEADLEKLRKENEELRNLKDAEEIKEIDYRKMDDWEEFVEKADELRRQLQKLPRLVPSVVYKKYQDDYEKPDLPGFHSPSERTGLEKLGSKGYIYWNDGWLLNEEHPRINQIEEAVNDLDSFLMFSKSDEIERRFLEEFDNIIFDLKYSPFWEKVLGVNIYHSGE